MSSSKPQTNEQAHSNRTASVLFILLLIFAGLAGVYTYQRLQYDFKTLEGESYRWEELKGQWIIVNYFAPWCAPCLREMPELAKFHASLPQNTSLFAINYDPKTKPELKAMVEKFNIAVPVIISNENTKLPMKKPPYLPATFILGPDGSIKDTIMGEVTAAHLYQRLSALKEAE